MPCKEQSTTEVQILRTRCVKIVFINTNVCKKVLFCLVAEGLVLFQTDVEDGSLLFNDTNTSKTTLIVKFKGSIDVIMSPVFLESIQRTFEALTPTFQTQHPISVVNHLHSGSLDRVESRNTLKKEKSLDLQEKLVTF